MGLPGSRTNPVFITWCGIPARTWIPKVNERENWIFYFYDDNWNVVRNGINGFGLGDWCFVIVFYRSFIFHVVAGGATFSKSCPQRAREMEGCFTFNIGHRRFNAISSEKEYFGSCTGFGVYQQMLEIQSNSHLLAMMRYQPFGKKKWNLFTTVQCIYFLKQYR